MSQIANDKIGFFGATFGIQEFVTVDEQNIIIFHFEERFHQIESLPFSIISIQDVEKIIKIWL